MHETRRSLFAKAGLAALGAMSATSRARAHLVDKASQWNPAGFRALLKRRALHRAVFDTTRVKDEKALNSVKNAFNGLQFGFSAAPEQIALVVALHGTANLLALGDAMWRKYQLGALCEVKDPATGAPALRNILRARTGDPARRDPDDGGGIGQDRTVEGLQDRGVASLSCHTATEEQAQTIGEKLDLKTSPANIASDLLAHLLPELVVVPAMVAALIALQREGRFAYVSVA